MGKIIAGPGVYVCDECVDLCVEILEHEPGDAPPPGPGPASAGEVEAAARAAHDADERLRVLARRPGDPARDPGGG